jgi:trk system potassium uptake protein
MNYRLTLYVLGGLLIFLGLTLLAPIPFSIYYDDGQILSFVLSAAITGLAGGFLFRRFRSVRSGNGRPDITLREGFAIVTFTWIGFALFGSLPYLFSGTLPHPIDAFFEAMSGFTTTGASVYTDVEVVPRSLLFWRALTQWVGGMGIIVLAVAVLPLLGVGGMQLYQAEAPGPAADRLTPRIQDTARLLWGVYVLVTAGGFVLLWLGEMDAFDAICHTFTAVATGGFSTRNASIGAFSQYTRLATMVVMILGAVNFALHYYALRGRVGRYWASDELRFYLGLLAGAILIVFAVNWRQYDDVLANLSDSAFNVTSIVTTTGFATADFDGWPVLARGLLFLFMFLGGCAGSTSGGLKQARVLLLLKHAFLQTARLIHPRQVQVLKLDHRPVSAEIMQGILGFTVLFLGVFVIGSLLVAATGVDLITAGSGVVACMSTVGPGLGGVGPAANYAWLPCFAKLVLSLCMLLGRLEISTVLVLLFITFWRK